MSLPSTTFCIGLGADNRHDGTVGLWLARTLTARGATQCVALSRDDAALIEAMDTHSDVILVDATQSGHAPGTITRFDASAAPVPLNVFRHPVGSVGAAEAVETARAMGCLPPKLQLVGIEGKDFSPGTGLTPQVEWAAARLLDELLQKIG
ncbi:hydrogenase maturation protease [Aliiruegeria sabulilitoris]|uniref:hydrogenase maturation protease n=1 Tax=Aliiruegeria sabulilitoris TaxID=1510458 RepID=UPI0012E36047|nr:hydrogenase maturation protease [Aliiruegeria sabulilitoris]NDR56130.1 hydrogenase maturation protease [Pseudoruegeria sp. M32A2M]